jgi:uncharacterized membrane-anchored protein
MSFTYTIMVDDNFHYMDEEERYTQGVVDTAEEALKICRDIVDQFLANSFKEGITAEALYQNYTMFGEDPFVQTADPDFPRFSAWTYAKERCVEMCKS